MQCVILAAGRGTRLQLRGDSKPLVPVFGVPLIERVVDSAQKAGISRFVVVTGHRAAKVEDFLGHLSRRRNVQIDTAFNEHYELENGYSVLAAKPEVEGRFLLLMADHIVAPESLVHLMRQPAAADEVLLGVDSGIDNPSVDLDDVTRVCVRNGRIRDIGKGLTNFNAFDTGMFLAAPTLFDAVAEACGEGDTSLSGAIRVLARSGRAAAAEVGGAAWIDVDDPAAMRKAEELLLAKLRSAASAG